MDVLGAQDGAALCGGWVTLCCSASVLAFLCKNMQYLYFKAITKCALKPLFYLLPPCLSLPYLFLPLALLYVHDCLILSANFFQSRQMWVGLAIRLLLTGEIIWLTGICCFHRQSPPLQMISTSFKEKRHLQVLFLCQKFLRSRNYPLKENESSLGKW